MLKHREITENRIARFLNERIRPLFYDSTAPLSVEASHVKGEPISAQEAAARCYVPFSVGELWGAPWNTTWFRFSGSIPPEWKGREVVALVRLGILNVAQFPEGFSVEGMVWQNGVPRRAINVNRSDIPLAAEAAGGETFQFYVEGAANPCIVWGRPATGGTLSLPEPEGEPRFTLAQAELACVNREAFALYYDVKVAHLAMMNLPENEPRRGRLLYALNEAVNRFDAGKDLREVRSTLREVMSAKNGSSAHCISAIGHAHIDTAWLWPLREAIRKCARTFSSVLANMERYPEYKFACSQAQQYLWMKELYPDIFEGIKRAVKRGQWEPVGSMWVEADCNLPSGESLVRQMLNGKRFFLEEFGYETKDVWIPDVFGYAGSLPQIMKKAGVNYFLTQKISWSQFNRFPHHTFLWEGIDGTSIFSHFPPADDYNGKMDPKQLLYNVHNFKDHDRASCSLYLFGHGDGGGGPTPEMLELARREKDFEGLPKFELERAADFFPKAEADAKDLPVWVGELYLELHRGTYTTQARNKMNNRKSELLLREVEFFDSVVCATQGERIKPAGGEVPRAVYDVAARNGGDQTAAGILERAWKLLLLNQFHDIIPGSSIHWVYQDSEKDYATIRALANQVLAPARELLLGRVDTTGLQAPFALFNPLGQQRSEVVSLPDGSPLHVNVPPCGYAVVDAKQKGAPALSPVTVESAKGTIAISNGILRVEFDENGLIASIVDLALRREVLVPGQRANVLQLHPDQPNQWDAWDVDVFYREVTEDLTGLSSIEVVENNPLRATVRVVRKFGESTLVQNVRLSAGSRRIDFETEVDWQEQHRFLKVAFPVAIHAPRATYEIQFGHTERPTHLNTSWDLARFEVCAHKWVDLSESDYGVALLNDSKYGHDIQGNVIRLSLLRAPDFPNPVADRGPQKFVYSLLPHPGGHCQGGVIEEACALNSPLVPVAVPAGSSNTLPREQSFFRTDRPGVIVEAIKKAEEGNAVIVRFYEAYRTRGPVTLTTTLPFKEAFLVDLLERPLKKIPYADGKLHLEVSPFEIVTVKLTLE